VKTALGNCGNTESRTAGAALTTATLRHLLATTAPCTRRSNLGLLLHLRNVVLALVILQFRLDKLAIPPILKCVQLLDHERHVLRYLEHSVFRSLGSETQPPFLSCSGFVYRGGSRSHYYQFIDLPTRSREHASLWNVHTSMIIVTIVLARLHTLNEVR
jgi:hypothetical protein